MRAEASDAMPAPGPRLGEILEHSSAYFESFLWDSDVGRGVRTRLSGWGIEDHSLRAFGVGYAPDDTRVLRDHLRDLGYSPEELIAAGIAAHSGRGHLHVRFHARIMFPVRTADGRLIGFAGLATHLGPSWPLWLTSPKGELFDPGTAIFGIGEARRAITETKRAVVLRDCVQVLALNQRDQANAVAIVHSPITRRHIAQLREAIDADEIHLARRYGRLGVVALPAGEDVAENLFPSPSTPSGFMVVRDDRRPTRAAAAEPSVVSPPEHRRTPAVRLSVYLAAGVIGIGIPIGLLLVAAPHDEAGHIATGTLNIVIVGVATLYLVLTLIAARVSGRARARSSTRRMRPPWSRGSDEVQPRGWTHHPLEEILVGAALMSAVTCVVLLLTLGGFLG